MADLSVKVQVSKITLADRLIPSTVTFLVVGSISRIGKVLKMGSYRSV